MRSFEYKDEKSDKFWNIELDGTSTKVHYGRSGTDGQRKEKDHGTEEKAQKEYDKLIAQKVKKGYVEV